MNTSEEIKSILASARTIAVVGCSDRPSRASYAIYQYLKSRGYDVVPVNPNHPSVDGDLCYPDLLSIPDDVRIDVVDVFRNPRHTAEMVQIAILRAKSRATRPTIWTQLGVSTSEAESLAKGAGLPYVKNRCILVEHARLIG